MVATELEQMVVQLRLTELDIREKILVHIQEIHRQSLWKEAGYKSLQQFCEIELDYNAMESREIAIEVGVILTTEKMVVDDPLVQSRIEMLKSWRKQQATLKGVAAYRILTNRTLFAIAKQNPRTAEDLRRVPGMGDKKMENFSRELLSISIDNK
jgi:ribonuclease D